MTPTITTNAKEEFAKVFNQYIPRVRRELADVTNEIMFDVVNEARNQTPEASRQQILKDLGAEDVYRTSKKTGEKKRGFKLTKGRGNPFAILRYWANKKGWTIAAKDERKAARKLIGRRLSAVGILRRGWNLPLKKFAAAAKKMVALTKGGVKQRGSATIARPGWNPVATAEYSMATKDAGGSFQIDSKVVSALDRAFDVKTQKLKQEIANALQP